MSFYNEKELLQIIKNLSDRLKTLEQTKQSRLVVPSYASDPAGGDSSNGQVYYNTTTNVFRKYENGSWANL